MRSTAGDILRVVAIGALIVLGVATVLLAWSVQPRDGNQLAYQLADETAELVAGDLGYQKDPADAAAIVEQRLRNHSEYVTPVQWSGSTRIDDKAIITVRITRTVSLERASTIFAPSNTAGSAERCYRFKLVYQERPTKTEIDCAGLPSRKPTPEGQVGDAKAESGSRGGTSAAPFSSAS